MTKFRGTIQCDGYSAYRALVARYRGIKLAGCLAHIRRRFFEARTQAPEVALPILLEIQKLYRIEEQLRQSQALWARASAQSVRVEFAMELGHLTICHLRLVSAALPAAEKTYLHFDPSLRPSSLDVPLVPRAFVMRKTGRL